MTKQADVQQDKNYLPILNHGFIGIASEEDINGNLTLSIMGNDSSIARAARMSYGKGTKAISNDRILVRYLMRHKHTTPIEMIEIKFHMKMPIFVARQIVRHRTTSINEYSGRYSIMSDEFYIPENDVMQPQSTTNKQGREGTLSDQDKESIKWTIKTNQELSYELYTLLMTPAEELDDEKKFSAPYGLYEGDMFTEDYPGLSRELARMVLPLNNYTEWYWKCDLHNIFRFLSLRMDSHAQYEIRVYANAMFELIKPHLPIACEAFEDYMLHSNEISRMETKLIKDLLQNKELSMDQINPEDYGLSKREWTEFQNKFKTD